MAKEISAGLLMYDIIDGEIKILLAKPGGPYFYRKNKKCFGIPKGHVEDGESIKDTAIREFIEETGIKPHGPYINLDSVKYKSGKRVYAWAFRGKFDGKIESNEFELEWPPKSGKKQSFPELVDADMYTLEEAKELIMVSQEGLIETFKELYKDGKIND